MIRTSRIDSEKEDKETVQADRKRAGMQKWLGNQIEDHIIQNWRIEKNDMETEEETRAGQGSGQFPCPESDYGEDQKRASESIWPEIPF